MGHIVSLLDRASYIAPLGMPNSKSRNVEHVHIARIHHPEHGGMTGYLKLYPYDGGNSRGLVNEITAFVFAKALTLPTPNSAFVIPVPLASVPKPAGWMKDAIKKGLTHYPAFGTRELGHEEGALALDPDQDSQLLRAELRNWAECPAAVTFDETIAHTDRHLGNVYRLSREKYALFDHGRLAVSRGARDWIRRDLEPARDFWNRLLEELFDSRPPATFVSMMQHHGLRHEAVLKTVQSELHYWWKCLIPIEDDRLAFGCFLTSRAERICDIIRARYNGLA